MKRFIFMFVAAACFLFSSNSRAVDFSGKRIEIIVPAGAGGGLTRNARVFAKHFSKHIPGNPTVVVKNIPGGGGQKGINFVYTKGRKDGTQIVYGPMNFVGINVGLAGIKYVPKKFKLLGFAGATPFVTIVRKDIKGGINSREDIMQKSGFVTGGRIPGGNLGLLSRMPFAILGIKNRFVVGYKNQPKLKAAMMQNEIQALTTGNVGYFVFYLNDTLKKGNGVALFSHPSFDVVTGKFRQSPHIKGVPRFTDFYAKLKGGEPSGDAWEAYKWKVSYDTFSSSMYMHPDTPDNITRVLQKAWKDNWNDPAMQKRFIKRNKAMLVTLQGAAAAKVIEGALSMSPGAKRYFSAELGIAKKSRKKK